MLFPKYKKLIIIPLALLCQTTQAQQIRPLGVDELFMRGIENSFRVQSSNINIDIAAEQQKQARSAQLPELTVQLSGGYIGTPTVFKTGLTSPSAMESMPSWSQNYNVEFTEPLYMGGKLRKTIEKSSLQSQITTLDKDKEIVRLKLLLMEQYLRLLSLDKQRQVVTQNITEAQNRLHNIEQMKRQGMITNNDLIRSQLQLTNYELTLRQVTDQIRINSAELSLALGLPTDQQISPDTTILDSQMTLDGFDDYLSQAHSQYPELKMAALAVDKAHKDIAITKADNLPALSLFGGNTLARPVSSLSPPQDIFMNTWNVGLVLSYRLSSLYKNNHSVTIARHYLSLEEVQQKQLLRDIENNLRAAYIHHQEALQRVTVLTLAVKQANENYRIVYNKYKNQLMILTDLLDATSVRLDAQLQLTSARANVVLSYYQLLAQSGNL